MLRHDRQARIGRTRLPFGTKRRRIPDGYVADPVDVEQRRAAPAVPIGSECGCVADVGAAFLVDVERVMGDQGFR